MGFGSGAARSPAQTKRPPVSATSAVHKELPSKMRPIILPLDECVNRFFVTAQESGFRGSNSRVQGSGSVGGKDLLLKRKSGMKSRRSGWLCQRDRVRCVVLSAMRSPLWEWLPATIIAVRRGGLPQKNMQLHWKPVTAGCAVLCGTKSPRPPFPKGERHRRPSYSPFSKGGWGDFGIDFLGRDHPHVEMLRADGFTHAGNPR